MPRELPADLQTLVDQLRANGAEAHRLTAGLDEERGTWRREPGSWSVAECLDHLATANRVYIEAMVPAAATALASGRRRRGPAIPGLVGRWFVRLLEPPVSKRLRGRAPKVIQPRVSPPLADALAAFRAAQAEVEAFITIYADLDLNGVRFVNPFVKGVRFSLATGLHVIPAHERRHLWQAGQVIEAMR